MGFLAPWFLAGLLGLGLPVLHADQPPLATGPDQQIWKRAPRVIPA